MQQTAKFLMIAIFAGSLGHVGALSASAGIFPDKNLEAAVRALIFEKKDKTDELTEEDAKKVFLLESKGKGIKDLTGIEKCTNLLQLNLAKNEIVDVTPLKDLKNIQSLDLAGNKVSDISPLAGLTALQNDKKLKMKPYEPMWWQFGLESPPMAMGNQRRVQFQRH